METAEISKYFDKLINLQIEFMSSYGRYLKAIGEFEEFTGKSVYDFVKEAFRPEILGELARSIPPDILGEFFAITFEMISLTSRIRDISKLKPKEKIEIGERFIELSKRLQKLIEKLKSISRRG